mgnify:CR=1 FL=1
MGGGAVSGSRALPGWAAALLVFLSSGAVLVLELSALRLLAPYLGLTLETSTAVIGVALAAIAFGTWAGGRTADQVEPARALGPLLLAGGVLTWLVLPASSPTLTISWLDIALPLAVGAIWIAAYAWFQGRQGFGPAHHPVLDELEEEGFQPGGDMQTPTPVSG